MARLKRSRAARRALPALLGALLVLTGAAPVRAAAAGAAVPRREATASQAVAADEQAFAVDLLKELTAAGRGMAAPNMVVSPSSLAVLLAMLEPGAAGATQTGIAAALGSGTLSAAQQALGWRRLSARLSDEAGAKAGKVKLQVANRAWLQDGLDVLASYTDLLSTDFGAGVGHQDIAGDPSGAAAAIDNWVSAHTGGHIKRLVRAADLERVVAVLVDAVYFDAAWADPFDPSLTSPHKFYVSSSQVVQTPMMSADHALDVPVSVSLGLKAAVLPYKGGHFQALVLMPTLGTLASFEQHLSPTGLARIIAHMTVRRVELQLPRTSLNSNFRLDQVLAAMGMGAAFSDNADFSHLSPTPLRVGFVVQDAQMVLDERGTEASAASGAGLVPTAIEAPPPVPLVFDHPYLVLVRDSTTGVVLFEAQVTDPAAG